MESQKCGVFAFKEKERIFIAQGAKAVLYWHLVAV